MSGMTIRRGVGSAVRVHRQQGLATLAAVMVLFFVVAMVAAYSSRNLVFEQRTSVNQLRATQAVEAAQAGMEWALGMLNGGRVTAACTATADTAFNSFRERYLDIDAASANVTPRTTSDGGELLPTCVMASGGLTCDCPTNAAPTLVAPTDVDVRTAFRVRFSVPIGTARPRTVQVDVLGCTKLTEGCLDFSSTSSDGQGRARVSAIVAMRSAVPTAPGAAVTARGAVSGALLAYNTAVTGSGITIQSGATVTVPTTKLFGPAGTPPEATKIDSEPKFADAALAGAGRTVGDRMFAAHFGLWPGSYRDQPSVAVINCNPTCNETALVAAHTAAPQRLLWVNGNVTIDNAVTLGSAAVPVLVFINGGSLTFTAAATIHGVLYVGRDSAVAPAAFAITGPGTIRGALMAEHALTGLGDTTVVHDEAVVRLLRQTRGSFAMVPGTWKDF